MIVKSLAGVVKFKTSVVVTKYTVTVSNKHNNIFYRL